jgi:hypothetical protein
LKRPNRASCKASTHVVGKLASIFGRQWLSTIPFNASLPLTAFGVSAALHLRMLHTGIWVAYRHCGQPNDFDDDEVYHHRVKWNVA